MTLSQFLAVLRGRLLTFLLVLLVCLAAAAGLTKATHREYRAESQVFVSPQGNVASFLGQSGAYIQQRVQSYADLVTNRPILGPVIAALGLQTSVTSLAKEVNANVPNGTALVDIQVTDRNAARAADLANAISYQLIAVVNQYETSAAGSSPVKLTITEPATVPASPVSPKPVLNLILGALIGVILGIGAALLRDAMDTRLASAEETEGIAGAPLLGAIPRERRGAKKHLMVNGPRSWIEAFGLLRTNLQFVEVVNEPHSVVVTSANPGEGKTTIACNLAISLAQVGIRTVLLDGDLRRPAIAEYMNLPNATGLTNVLVRQASLEQALQTWQGGGDIPLRVLTSGPLPPNPSQLVGSSAMAGVIEELESSADVVIIDAPPILTVSDAAALAASADGALLLVRPNHTRREQLQGAVRALAAVGSPLLGITLNMTARMGNYGVYSYYEYTQSQARRSPRQPSSVE